MISDHVTVCNGHVTLRYLISEINYGGRVTDDWDRRLMNVYMASFFNEDALGTPLYRLSSLPSYVVPEDGPLSSYREVCAGLPLHYRYMTVT